jgi:hypothetical protein
MSDFQGTMLIVKEKNPSTKLRRSTALPLPPFRFVVAPTRIPREQRKVEKRKKKE